MPSVSFPWARNRDSEPPRPTNPSTKRKQSQPLQGILKHSRSKPLPPMPAMEQMPSSSARPQATGASTRPIREPLSSIQAEVGSVYTNPRFDAPGAYYAPRNASTVRFKIPSASPEPQHHPRYPEYVTRTRIPSPPAPPTARPRHPSPAGQLPPKRVGPLRLLRTLSSGAFGRAFAAHDTGSGALVCVRIADKERLLADEAGIHLNGLLRELLCYKIIAATAPRRRGAQHLMELHGILQDDKQIYHIMPLMHCDLLSVINGPCDKALTRRWVAQLALGIDALHRMGIIHRDIKPENVLLDGPDGNVRITDFNTAFVSPSNEPLEEGSVYAQQKTGSEPYMAWEVSQHRWYGKMCDWWSLGCLMYDLVTGKLLFKNESKVAKYVAWDARAEGRSYITRTCHLSKEEESVMNGLLAISPCFRWQLRNLRHHTYFLDEHRTNVFDVLLREPRVDLLTAGRFPRAEQLQVEECLRDAPLLHAALLPRTREDPREAYDFLPFAWVNPQGLYRL